MLCSNWPRKRTSMESYHGYLMERVSKCMILPHSWKISCQTSSNSRNTKVFNGNVSTVCAFVETHPKCFRIVLRRLTLYFVPIQSTVNLWGFERITKGIGKGGYSRDEFFCRKDSDQISRIKRRKIKKPRFAKKKAIPTTEIIDIPSSNLDTEQCVQTFCSTSIVSNSCSDVSSISSDSDSERGSTTSLGMNEDLSPVPISEMIHHGSCPQTGDCLDFEGRNYFFVDEEEVVESTRKISESNIVSPTPTKTISTLQTPSVQRASQQKITLCPSSMAGIALYRQFFSSNVSTPRIGNLRARNTWN